MLPDRLEDEVFEALEEPGRQEPGMQGWATESSSWRRKRSREGAPGPGRARRYRKKAYQWLLATDNMLQMILAVGWRFFCPEHMTAAQRSDPSTWPVCTVALDQGSDGWCAVMYLAYCLELCQQKACLR